MSAFDNGIGILPSCESILAISSLPLATAADDDDDDDALLDQRYRYTYGAIQLATMGANVNAPTHVRTSRQQNRPRVIHGTGLVALATSAALAGGNAFKIIPSFQIEVIVFVIPLTIPAAKLACASVPLAW